MKKYFLYIIAFCSLSLNASAQKVVLRGLNSNPALQPSTDNIIFKAPAPPKDTTLQMPFYEDFSHSGVYPSTDKWMDRQAFINNTFPLYPPTVGVATLDALDASGAVYSQASPLLSFPADTLTSVKIRLDSSFFPVTRSLYIYDSVYFSFYYQPGGGYGNTWDSTIRGNAPKKGDSLILEFFSSADSSWIRQWATGGSTFEEFCPDCVSDSIAMKDKHFFKKITIPVVDSAKFFKKDFQFRFRNLASIDAQWKSSNSSWHLDYIELNKYRKFSDTTKDIAFVNPAVSLLKKFQAVPYKQFVNTDVKDNVSILVRNMSKDPYLALYYYEILDNAGLVVAKNPASGNINTNIYPFDSGFYTDPDISSQPVAYSFPNVTTAPTNYTIRHVISMATQPDIDQIRKNDTIVFSQVFSNYYAYDDGSAEAGIGIEGSTAMALRFPMRVKDTLTAVDIFFNEEQNSANMENAFTLCVWQQGSNGLPSTKIYTQERLLPEYGETLNQFKRYKLSSGLLLDAGNYFVGYEQPASAFLNIGFDQNNDASENLFYYDISSVTPQWLNVFYYGAIMMRPVFGIAAVTKNTKETLKQTLATVYPNPTTGNITIECPADNISRVELTDITGKILFKQHFSSLDHQQTLTLSGFASGIYLLKIFAGDNLIFKKIIKQ